MNEEESEALIMKILREAPGNKRVYAKRNNRILLDLVNNYSAKERERLVSLIELLEDGGCEGPEIGFALASMYTKKITSLVATTMTLGFPEVGFSIANMLHVASVDLGCAATESMLNNQNKEAKEACDET